MNTTCHALEWSNLHKTRMCLSEFAEVLKDIVVPCFQLLLVSQLPCPILRCIPRLHWTCKLVSKLSQPYPLRPLGQSPPTQLQVMPLQQLEQPMCRECSQQWPIPHHNYSKELSQAYKANQLVGRNHPRYLTLTWSRLCLSNLHSWRTSRDSILSQCKHSYQLQWYPQTHQIYSSSKC